MFYGTILIVYLLLQKSEEEYFNDVLVKLVGNPVHVFNLLDRFVNILPAFKEELSEEQRAEVDAIVEDLEMPDESDVEGATQALVRIQFAYR